MFIQDKLARKDKNLELKKSCCKYQPLLTFLLVEALNILSRT